MIAREDWPAHYIYSHRVISALRATKPLWTFAARYSVIIFCAARRARLAARGHCDAHKARDVVFLSMHFEGRSIAMCPSAGWIRPRSAIDARLRTRWPCSTIRGNKLRIYYKGAQVNRITTPTRVRGLRLANHDALHQVGEPLRCVGRISSTACVPEPAGERG